jgi:alginate O-acetyltransferase complex protein AlgI
MLFSSITFLILFLPLVLLVYYYCPIIKAKNYFLFLASLIFYAWGEPKYVLVMLLSIAVNYRMGLWISEVSYTASKRKIILAIAITTNLLLLFYFKYLGFAEQLINRFITLINFPQPQIRLPDVALPIGISFYTFQLLSYLIDVYRKPELVQKNLLDLGLYISFFPQLIAGPIVRYHDINEQIKDRNHRPDIFAQGIERFIIGLAKKVLIANAMAEVVDAIFILRPDTIPAVYLVLGVISYSFQIYYDFSGYSDMAIGLGKMFGFDIRENFVYPYISRSITEFWRRWHISLSSWFKDYLYIPLGGNRKGKFRTTVNLFIVFFTTGLWHGAKLQFIFWGMGHGVLLFIEKIFGERVNLHFKEGILKRIVSHTYTICSVMLLWMFFRLGIKNSFNYIKLIFSLNGGNDNMKIYIRLFMDPQYYVRFAFAILFSFPWWRRIRMPAKFHLQPVRYAVLIVLFVLSISTLATNAYNPFIYFRF